LTCISDCWQLQNYPPDQGDLIFGVWGLFKVYITVLEHCHCDVSILLQMFTHTHTHTHTHTYTHTCVCVCVCVRGRTRVFYLKSAIAQLLNEAHMCNLTNTCAEVLRRYLFISLLALARCRV
jgi:hypothetical protein